MKNAVVALLPFALAVSVVAGATAEAPRTLKVEVRVWQDVDDERRLWLSARPAGGSWARMGTVPLWLDGGGRHRYGDRTLGAAPDAIDQGDGIGEGYYFLDDYYLRGRLDAPLLIRVPAGRRLSWFTVVEGGNYRVEAFIIGDSETGSYVYYDARTGRETKRRLRTPDAATRNAVNALFDRLSSAARPAPVPVVELRWATPVEVRVWQDVRDGRRIHLSARAEGGSWRDAGTIPVPLDDGLSATGRYRYGDAVIALSVPPPPSCVDAALAADCAALLAARDALAGDGSLNWSASVPVTRWDGVTISGTPRRVTGLALRSRGLTGVVPPELADLSALKALKLARNELAGCIPQPVRQVPGNDLARLTVPTCGVTIADPGMSLDGGRTYQLGISGLRDLLLDIPAAARGIEFRYMSYDELWGIVYCLADAAHPGSQLCLRRGDAAPVINHVQGEGSAVAAARAIFDQIAASARLEP